MRNSTIKNLAHDEDVSGFRELLFTKLDVLQQEMELFGRLHKTMSADDVASTISNAFYEVSVDQAVSGDVTREQFLETMGAMFDEMKLEQEQEEEDEGEEEDDGEPGGTNDVVTHD